MAAALKDQINADLVQDLAGRIAVQDPTFPREPFVDSVLARLDELELKDRINLVADALRDHLPQDYPAALATLVAVADETLAAWAAWPLCSFVERHGIDHPDESLAAMPDLTKCASCEFAIRPFLDAHLDRSLDHMRRWVQDDDAAVRRLPSEGSRPLLPWGPRVPALDADPRIGLEFVTALRHDPSEVVRRSVANHLNDIAKAHPDLVIDVLRAWTSESPPVDGSMVRHALRTLVKRGDPAALELLGFTTDPQIDVGRFECCPSDVTIGMHVELSATITSTAEAEQHLVVDFVIHHVRANGATSPKTFKWTTLLLAPGATVDVSKRRLIQQASTRTYHAGIHCVDLQVGGRRFATTEFDLGLG